MDLDATFRQSAVLNSSFGRHYFMTLFFYIMLRLMRDMTLSYFMFSSLRVIPDSHVLLWFPGALKASFCIVLGCSFSFVSTSVLYILTLSWQDNKCMLWSVEMALCFRSLLVLLLCSKLPPEYLCC